MSVNSAPDLQALMTKLVRLHGLSFDDRTAFEKLPFRIVEFASGQNIA